jgi:predicted esterase
MNSSGASLLDRHPLTFGPPRTPVLISHSKEDTVVPYAHAQRLYERVTAPKMFAEIHGGHHGGKFDSKEIYAAALKAFFKENRLFQDGVQPSSPTLAK